MTGKELCEHAARIAFPNADDNTISRIGVAIWEASPMGDVYPAAKMIGMSDEELREYVPRLNNVARVAGYEQDLGRMGVIA